MSDLFGRSSSAAAPADMAARKEAMMNAVRQELAVQNAQELMNKTTYECYAKCVIKPGDSLSRSEQSCLSDCMQRYMEAFNIVSRAYTARIARESRERSGAEATLS
ncbi:hypothetical protein D9619_004514 [Psilocybe cf. subviscida]|uniref:Mitochondrial import inner membrane translocase subunit n=1 Tax=Psilocybe cf. subviscida TaxID=2480587 RepID=A0A8H5BQF6_9AGAR|nr:hypothetical protein D9619_004514 [Psilocybe cf. subviscida]